MRGILIEIYITRYNQLIVYVNVSVQYVLPKEIYIDSKSSVVTIPSQPEIERQNTGFLPRIFPITMCTMATSHNYINSNLDNNNQQ